MLANQKPLMIFLKDSACSEHFRGVTKMIPARRASVHATLRALKNIFIF
jgi:hypothetical protein